MQKILVVDDNSAFTELVEMVFSGEYEVVKAGDGEEGINAARQTKPDVILLDVMMPKVSGVEMLRLLQADLDTRTIPVVILTASHFDPSTQQMFEQEPNVYSFLKKPCGVETMRNQIKLALTGKRV
ncbi:MAG: response regulator [Elusimicrobia bacterium]|nr:response regulator [Elusimicrobiota bacterium]